MLIFGYTNRVMLTVLAVKQRVKYFEGRKKWAQYIGLVTGSFPL